MYNETAYALGSVRSYIREVFEYGRQQSRIVGEENVFDYSLGNPSIPAPEKVNQTICHVLDTESSIKVHGYTSGPGDDAIREAVSANLTERFGKKIRPENLFFNCGAAPALVSALIWLLLFSSVFRLETSQISVSGGNEWVSEKDVLDIANQQSGRSLFLVSADKVSSQLKNIPGVTQANVVKRYPRSLEIDIKAQQPAAMLKEPDGTLVAVDRKARVLNAVGKASMKGIPVIEVSSVDNGLNSRAVKEALTILGGLPDTMRTVITKVSAKTQDSITTELSSGKYVVVWGDSSELKLKSAIVDKLLSDPSLIGDKHQIDVSAPSRPIIK